MICLNVLDLVLEWWSDITEGNWRQLFFYFNVIMKVVASFTGMSFYHMWVWFEVEVFSHCSVTETFAIGFRKWYDHERVDLHFLVGFFFRFIDLVYASIKSAKIAKMWLPFDNIKSFWLFEGRSDLFFNCACTS